MPCSMIFSTLIITSLLGTSLSFQFNRHAFLSAGQTRLRTMPPSVWKDDISVLSKQKRFTTHGMELSMSTGTDKASSAEEATSASSAQESDRLGMYAPADGDDEFGLKNVLIPLLIAAAGAALYYSAQAIDFDDFLQRSVSKIESLGPWGYLYFGLVYIVAEVLAVPAIPLTTSSGYLFGLLPGTLIVLVSATIAASLSFIIGRTYLRSWAQSFIEGSPKWRAVDKAVAKEGFKVVLLLRLSPLLPFALSNYLYAVTSVDFGSFISATFLGFAPGSFGYVYFGSIGKEVFSSSSSIPWYGFAAIGALIIFAAQTIGKIATDAVKEMEIDGEPESYDGEGI